MDYLSARVAFSRLRDRAGFETTVRQSGGREQWMIDDVLGW